MDSSYVSLPPEILVLTAPGYLDDSSWSARDCILRILLLTTTAMVTQQIHLQTNAGHQDCPQRYEKLVRLGCAGYSAHAAVGDGLCERIPAPTGGARGQTPPPVQDG